MRGRHPKLCRGGRQRRSQWVAYVEKLLRLLVCETLRESAPGIEYNASMIVNLAVLDPWTTDAAYTVPPVRLVYTKIKQQAGRPVIDAWAA
jgi:hypothetical protein